MLTHVSLVGLVGMAGGCGLVVTSMVTSHWMILTDETRIGLFSHCSSDKCTSINLTVEIAATGRDVHSQFKAVRGLVITGLIVGICGFLMALGFVADALRSKGVKSLALLRSSLILNPLGGVICILGASVFAATLYRDMSTPSGESSLGFSFVLCICGGGSLLVSGVLVFVGGPRQVTRTIHASRTSAPSGVLSCVQPPPGYAPPSEEFLIAQFHPPPAYEDKIHPPSYDDVFLLPPPYDESGEIVLS